MRERVVGRRCDLNAHDPGPRGAARIAWGRRPARLDRPI